jgi:hypothetical protein
MPGVQEPQFLTMGVIAGRYGVKQWQVRRLFERNLLPEPMRVGAYRVIRIEDLPAVEQALRAAGYIKSEALTCAG